MNQIDIEELVSRCNSPRTKLYFREAVDCYTIGAYRACIVTTWITVVYDIIEKLRELDLTGDAQATAKVKEFETISAKADVTAALAFEREILAIARDPFELLTAHEVLEIARLQEDRNRCAHPNLVRDNDSFKPAAELARVHLRHAADLILSRPPVQSRAALQFLHTQVESAYFPTTTADALDALKTGPLARAKDNLVKEFVLGALTSCVKESLSTHQVLQRLSAVEATKMLHPQLTQELFRDRAGKVFARIDDSFLARGIFALRRLPDLVPLLDKPTKQKFNTYVSTMPDSDMIPTLAFALRLDEFRAAGNARLQSVTDEYLAKLIEVYLSNAITAPVEIVERSIVIYSASTSFANANSIAKEIVLPLLPSYDANQAERIMRCASNGEVKYSFEFKNVVQAIKSRNVLEYDHFIRLFGELGIAQAHPSLSFDENPLAHSKET